MFTIDATTPEFNTETKVPNYFGKRSTEVNRANRSRHFSHDHAIMQDNNTGAIIKLSAALLLFGTLAYIGANTLIYGVSVVG